jgi:hypothetical protein
LSADASPEEHFGLLTRPPICVDGAGDIRVDRTVAAVVVRPDAGELHVRPGNPARSATQVFRLSLEDEAGRSTPLRVDTTEGRHPLRGAADE